MPDEQTLLNSATLDAHRRVLAVGRVINAAEGSYLGVAVPLLEDGSPDPSFTVDGSRPLVDFNPRRVLVDALRLSTLQPRATPCVDRSRHPQCG